MEIERKSSESEIKRVFPLARLEKTLEGKEGAACTSRQEEGRRKQDASLIHLSLFFSFKSCLLQPVTSFSWFVAVLQFAAATVVELAAVHLPKVIRIVSDGVSRHQYKGVELKKKIATYILELDFRLRFNLCHATV